MLNNLQSIFKYSVIAGLMPVVEKDESYHRKVQQRKLYTLLLLLTTALFGISGIIIRPVINVVVSDLVSVVVLCAQILSMSIALTEGMLTVKHQERFFAKAQEIELMFWRQLSLRFCARSQTRYLLRKYTLIILIMLVCMVGALVLVNTNFYYGHYCYALPSFMIIRLRGIQLSIYADIIGFYLEGLNCKLMAIWSCKVQQQRRFLDVNYSVLESLEQLMLLKGLYREITELLQIWQKCFGWSALAVVWIFYFELTINAYWTFLTLAGIYAFYLIYLTTMALMAILSLLLMVCFTCQKCERACRRTASLVHKLLQPFGCDANARLYNDLVNEFSLQIIENPIEFRGLDFFTINFKLLMAIFTSLSTHMVILLQFRTIDVDLEQSL